MNERSRPEAAPRSSPDDEYIVRPGDDTIAEVDYGESAIGFYGADGPRITSLRQWRRSP